MSECEKASTLDKHLIIITSTGTYVLAKVVITETPVSKSNENLETVRYTTALYCQISSLVSYVPAFVSNKSFSCFAEVNHCDYFS